MGTRDETVSINSSQQYKYLRRICEFNNGYPSLSIIKDALHRFSQEFSLMQKQMVRKCSCVMKCCIDPQIIT